MRGKDTSVKRRSRGDTTQGRRSGKTRRWKLKGKIKKKEEAK